MSKGDFEIPMDIEFTAADVEKPGSKTRFRMAACSDKINVKRIRFNSAGLAAMAGSDNVPVVVRGHEHGDGDLCSIIGFSDRRYVQDGWLVAEGYLFDSSPEAAQISALAQEDENYAKIVGGSICGKITNMSETVKQLEDDDGPYLECSDWGHWRHLLMCPNYGAAVPGTSAEIQTSTPLGIAQSADDWGEILVAASGQAVEGEVVVAKANDDVAVAFTKLLEGTTDKIVKEALLAFYQEEFGTLPVESTGGDSDVLEGEPVEPSERKDWMGIVRGLLGLTARPAEPEAKVDEPEAEEVEPEAKSGLSDEDITRIATELRDMLREPDAEVADPDAEVEEDADVDEPEAEVEVTEPEAEVAEPEVDEKETEIVAQLRAENDALAAKLQDASRGSAQLEVKASGAGDAPRSPAADNLGMRGTYRALGITRPVE